MTEKTSTSMALELLSRELKNARMERNLSIEDVSRLTTIQKNYLEKIEEGEFSFLPKAYIFSFIKEYALLMEVGNDETFEQCKKELQFTSALKLDLSIDKDFKKKETRPIPDTNYRTLRSTGSLILLIIGILFVLVAGLAFFSLNGKSHFSAHHSSVALSLPAATGEDTVAVAEQIVDSLVISRENKPAQNVVPLPADQPTPSKVHSVAKAASAPVVSAASVPKKAASAVSVPVSNSRKWAKNVSFHPSSPYRKVLVVRLMEESSWVKVIADDSSRAYPGGTFKKGQVLRYEARKNFWVNIGRPKYVELYLNGKKLPPITDRILKMH